MQRRLSDDDKRRIVKLISQGLSNSQIGQRFGKSKDAIRLVAQAHGVKNNSKKCGNCHTKAPDCSEARVCD